MEKILLSILLPIILELFEPMTIAKHTIVPDMILGPSASQARDTELLGVIPRAIHHIFELAKNPQILQFQVHCSFVQIYNENLFDMLR